MFWDSDGTRIELLTGLKRALEACYTVAGLSWFSESTQTESTQLFNLGRVNLDLVQLKPSGSTTEPIQTD